MHPLRIYRKARGLKLKDIASKTKISTASLSRIEKGSQFPSSRALIELVAYTDNLLTPNDFFLYRPEPTSEEQA